MPNEDTINLLKECDAGCKMGIDSIEQILDKVENKKLYDIIVKYLNDHQKLQNKITDKEINETLESVNLINEKDKKYSNYSLGMKQKLGVAQALMEDPEVIILDEPFNGIENASVEKIIDVLKKKKSEGKIIIVASHYMEELSNLCDKIYSFDMGEVSNYED